uniref:Ion_trans domain-containing protein n=1 Tax=Strongyloides stercoralis TaxID=6248 RepID=A0A0K0EPR9_STRER
MDLKKEYDSEEEDLLAQEVYYKSLNEGEKPAATVISSSKNKPKQTKLKTTENNEIKSNNSKEDINVDESIPSLPLEGVTEKYMGYFMFPEKCEPFNVDESIDETEDVFSSLTKESLVAEYKQKASRKFVPKKNVETLKDVSPSKLKDETSEEGEEKEVTEEEIIKKLEVMNPDDILQGKVTDKTRIAFDPVASNFEMQIINAIKPRIERTVSEMFNSLGCKPLDEFAQDDLYNEGIKRRNEIFSIYFKNNMEQQSVYTKLIMQDGINIHIDASWCITPLIKIVDENRHKDVIEVNVIRNIENILLFTYLLFTERTYYFYLRFSVGEFLLKLMRLYFLKSFVFIESSIISEFMKKMLYKYVLPEATLNKFQITKDTQINGIESIPEYMMQLCQSYEDKAIGNVIFTKYLLLFSYLNIDTKIMTFSVSQLWDINKDVVRQIILNDKDYPELMYFLEKRRIKNESILAEEQCPLEYGKLLTCYAVSLGKEIVTKSRSSLLFQIAINELKDFFKRHDNIREGDKNYVPEWHELIKRLKIMLKSVKEFN